MSNAVNPYSAPRAAVSEGAGVTEAVKVFSVSGRIGRVRYIAYGIGFYILFAIVGAGLGAVAGVPGMALAWAGWLVITFMLTIQRCHDFNTSGWLSLLVLVPLVNLIFWFIPGSDAPNRYGAPTPPNSTLVVVAACAVPILIFVVGILAAVSIPAYQDYTLRARVSEVIVASMPWRAAVSEHFAATGKLPSSAADLREDSTPVGSGSHYGRVSLGADGVLTLTMSEGTGVIAGKAIEVRPQAVAGALQWDCKGGTLPPKFRPATCRP